MRRTPAFEVPQLRGTRYGSRLSAVLLAVLVLGSAGSLAAQDPRTRLPGEIAGVILPDFVGNIVGPTVPTPSSRGSWLVVVENRSPREAGVFRAALYRQGSLVATKVFPGLPANGRGSLGTLWCWLSQTMTYGLPCPWPVGYGCKDSWITVDVTNGVPESKEGNNKYEFCWGAQTNFEPLP